ncbi:SDR family NAD(P)-dependent oxidoreductase [Micromonospora sp. HM5-17]|jgi:NAD(P)-dependent dehydrogenase (short-subunit alcohol dehydrogenase family)|uniref:SDR family NAD(P)-dependent oxidoreductase n=1 Tax=Micromonospora sp. HM5-17 TaxID=2487710 RepID=UPI000F47F1DC|nr:SDR family NAD(P)-dependent oxidoreductase [Micromonospora sp. HM5-17]ROT33858.1 SDR family NAD(P)-dependent oxidoreductase [Micromonospora sp. HM5-17]
MTETAKVALVTGGNRGIGYHVARQLAEAGVHVLLGARDLDRGRAAVAALAADGLDVHLVQLDVTDAASVAAAAKAIEADPGRLDILVNNAGIAAGFAPPSQASLDEVRATYETNVFGVIATTNAMLPLLRRSPAARIVNVTSVLGAMHLLTDPTARWADLTPLAYRSSKAALNAVTVLYATELRDTRITVNAICPGLRATGFGGGSPPPGAGDPAEGAAGVVRLALHNDDGVTGRFFNYDGTPYRW